jgi:predicted transposase YdaD
MTGTGEKMTQHAGGSLSRERMAEKEQIAQRLLQQGLTIGQVATQLRCSRYFVSKVKKALAQDTSSVA